MSEIEQRILEFLSEHYQLTPSRVFRINQLFRGDDGDPVEVSQGLLDQNLIRERRISGTTVHCRITIEGIEAIDSAMLINAFLDVIESLGNSGNAGNITEILQTDHVRYSWAFDFAEYMVSLGHITITMRNAHANVIMVALTPRGIEEFENRPAFGG